MHKNKISVLLAAYNGEKWIQDQLDSIIAQKNINIHIFISIDFSNDNTLDLCKTFELENNFLPILTKLKLLTSYEHKGYFYSINDKKELINAKKNLKNL